jgi:hypothetical protein
MAILALSPTYNQTLALRYFSACVLKTLNQVPDLQWVFIDNGSQPDTINFLKSLSHPQLSIIFLDKNIGKGNALNTYIQETIQEKTLPDILFSVDSDIIFSVTDFLQLCEGIRNIPNLGLLSPRYAQNSCNPERHLWFPAHSYKGQNGTLFKIKKPFLCNVAGGMIGLPGTVLAEELGYELYPKAQGQVYYPDDGFLYDKLKKSKKVMGYLEGTCIYHLRSNEKTAYPESPPSL